jgi:tRNA/rRNA methyltransferase
MLPAFVLVSPTLAANIGAVARVMANFGLNDLRIVGDAPWDDPQALATAAGGVEVLRGAARVRTLADALTDRDRVYATSALRKDLPLAVGTPRALGASLRADGAAARRTAVVFGPERTGLSLDDLSRADALVQIPTDPACRALNLAQSAAICAYEWRIAVDDGTPPGTPPHPHAPAPPPAPKEAVDGLVAHVAAALDERRQLGEPALRTRLLRSLRIAFGRGLTTAEIQTLRGVVSALTR